MNTINLIITDFDGTLVNTFEANYKAYQMAFNHCGLKLSEKQYEIHFGLRFEEFMNAMNISDSQVSQLIKEIKKEIYPNYFSYLKINQVLLNFIYGFKAMGGKTAIASTASRKNLMNVLNYIQATDAFDLILAGEDVKAGKPNPEIYKKALEYFNMNAKQALVFEDTAIGIKAAANAGINCIQIKSEFYGY